MCLNTHRTIRFVIECLPITLLPSISSSSLLWRRSNYLPDWFHRDNQQRIEGTACPFLMVREQYQQLFETERTKRCPISADILLRLRRPFPSESNHGVVHGGPHGAAAPSPAWLPASSTDINSHLFAEPGRWVSNIFAYLCHRAGMYLGKNASNRLLFG